MSIPGTLTPLFNSGAAGSAYSISRSLRFNSSDSAYLSRTPASAGNRKTWTWAGWVKRGRLGVANLHLFDTLGSPEFTGAYFTGSDAILIRGYTSTFNWVLTTTPVHRDPSSWYHIVLVFDSTNGTSSERVRIYVNGVRVTSFSESTYPSLNYDSNYNNSVIHYLGAFNAISGAFDGYLADVHSIDGQSLDPTSFGEFDATTGVWVPIEYTGTYGTNGFHLDFADNSSNTATTLGKDTSGNGNNWTPNNLSVTAGAGNDSLVDVPTNGAQTDTGVGGEVRGNYATLNPLGVAGPALTDGNLATVSSSTVGNRISTFLLTSGKWYWEASGTGYVGAVIGRDGAQFTGSISGTGSKSIGYFNVDGGAYWDGGNTTGTSYTATDVVGVALDMDTGNVKFYKNNTLVHNLTFGSGTVPNLSSGVFPGYNIGNSTRSATFNFGQRAFAYTAPSGFKALNTANLPAPVVTKPNTVMDVVLYTGNGSTQTISGLGFSPDFVWIKARNTNYSHQLIDIIRGGTKPMFSDRTDAEGTFQSITSFNSDGYTVSTELGVNGSGTPFVAWAWDAGSSTDTNTSGSITSSVRANATAGFSVVTYSISSASSTISTFGHGLGVAPSFVILKVRNAVDEWTVYHSGISSPTSNWLTLNTTNAAGGGTSTFSASSTTFGVRETRLVGSGGSGNILAYLFAPVVGYNSISSYTGNGSSDGVFVFTGMRPRWIMIKRTDTTSNWTIIDTAREGYNVDNDPLYPNLSNAEGTTDLADILSNGFKLRSTDASVNASGGTYVYAAFAESPFNYSRAR